MTPNIPYNPHLPFLPLIPILVVVVACGSNVDMDTIEDEAAAVTISLSEEAGESVGLDTDTPVIVDVSDAVTAPPEVRVDEEAEVPLPPTAQYTLRRGETLAHFARWSGLPVEVIAETSGLDLFDTFDVGTDIRVPVAGAGRAELESQRDLHHVKRAEGYLAARGGSLGTEFYTVQTGDSAWTIARNQRGIPVWLLETYNPSADLGHLRPGEELMVPIIADIVVDAADSEDGDLVLD